MGTWKNEYHARQLQNSFRQHEPSGLRSASFRHEMEFCRQWLSTDRPNVPGTGVSVQQPQVFSKTIANYFPPMSTVNGQTTTFAYDEANQLVSKTLPDGTTVTFGYDAAGRLVREGDRHYAYGWLDKVLAVTGADGETLAAYAYGLDGQLASATVGGATEEFLWDGLALVRRGATGYLNEPHANGGSPLLSSGGAILFNDLLGSTLGTLGGNGEYRAVSLTAFGDTEDAGAFFTGKPKVDGLGYAFLLRSYRPDHGKWLTADPLGYPDGWNQMAYCNNWVIDCFDRKGADIYHVADFDGCGHSGLIIGNSTIGYFAMDNGGTGSGGYNGGSVETIESVLAHRHATASAALTDLSGNRTGADEFDHVQKWHTSTSQDLAAVIAAKDSIDSDHNLLTNNCMATVDAALDAAGENHVSASSLAGLMFPFPPGLGEVVEIMGIDVTHPLVYYYVNLVYSDELDYESFKNGLLE